MLLYEFNGYSFNTDQGTLSKDSLDIPLRAKAARLLQLLLAHRNIMLSKEALYENLWGSTIVQDDALPKLINELRQLLGDNARSPQYIKTFHKRGYGWILEETTEREIQLPTHTPSIPHTSKQWYKKPITWVTTLAILLASGFYLMLPANEIQIPTIDAREAYLRGSDFEQRVESRKTLLAAADSYQQAITLQPDYALAMARLSVINSLLYAKAYDRSIQRRNMAEKMADNALTLAPDLPEAHFAKGFFYYHGFRDYDAARLELSIAEPNITNRAAIPFLLGQIYKQRGEYQKASDYFQKTMAINPRYTGLAQAIGNTNILLRRYSEAKDFLQQAISQAQERYQENPEVELQLGWNELNWSGGLNPAITALKKISTANQNQIFLFNIFIDEFQTVLMAASDSDQHIYENPYQLFPKPLLKAMGAFHAQGRSQQVVNNFQHSLDLLLTKKRDEIDPRLEMAIALSYAGLNDNKKAIEHSTLALLNNPKTRDAIAYSIQQISYAQLHTLLGNHKRAEEIKQRLVEAPSLLSERVMDKDQLLN